MSQHFAKPVAQGNHRLLAAALWMAASAQAIAVEATRPDPKFINLEIPRVSTDKSVRFDYDLVYIRAPRKAAAVWANTEPPTVNPTDAELMLLHADGSEEVLVPVEQGESIADPYVSFDGKSVYFAKYHAPSAKGAPGGSDIFKVDVATRQLVRLTHQEQTPNLGAVDPKRDQLAGVVFNLAPCPLPGGKLAFVSDRNCYRGVKDLDAALQLFTMDAGGANVEQIGHLNLGGAMHPVVLKDGRIMFSSSEGQGIRIGEQWGLWTIRPDGTHWEPLFSPFVGGSSSLHFQTQLTNGDVVVEFYYPGATTQGFGTFFRFPTDVPPGTAQFGPGWIEDPRNMIRARSNDVRMRYQKFPFSPRGARIVTEFATNDDVPPNNSRQDIGKVSHPSAAPDNHLLAIWTPPSTTRAAGDSKDFDSGIYLIKGGEPVNHPTEMLLVKNDPDYYEMWPRALTPYKRIYGIDEPARLAPVANDGQQSPHLTEGSPFGLVGTSSLYKRESYPDGVVPSGGVTATSRHGDNLLKMFMELGSVYRAEGTNNWTIQGADAGRYANEDIWGIRIVALEPVTHAWKEPRQFGHSSGGNGVGPHAAERLRILGEFPVRKFDAAGKQPLDADGNPDTSFLVKLPADVAWTFQTLDRRGMVLNMAQTWHQLRPGEIRHDCGGCHAHSQEPTRFERTAAAQSGYKPFDLTKDIPLFTTRQRDVSGKQWDADHKTGMRYTKTSVANVEYFRDVKPIFERSCVACHTNRNGDAAAGLVLDDEQPMKIDGLQAKVPGTYVRLAADNEAHFGPKPIGGQWHYRMQES